MTSMKKAMNIVLALLVLISMTMALVPESAFAAESKYSSNSMLAAMEKQSGTKGDTGSSGNVNITLAAGSTNILKAGGNGAGLQKNGADAKGILTISGSGTLNATGSGSGAGIGGGLTMGGLGAGMPTPNLGTKNITITGGTITAVGGYYGAGIGAGGALSGNQTASNITITGGVIKATGNQGAGIGGGYVQGGTSGDAKTIKITGGTVTASSTDGAGIGGGLRGSGSDVIINGGSVKATSKNEHDIGGGKYGGASVTPKNSSGNEVQLLEISNPDSKVVKIDGTEVSPKNHTAIDDDTTLYAYLTKSDHSIAVGDKQHNYKYENGQFVLKGTISLTNPVTLRIDAASNEWMVSYDDGDTWNRVLDDKGNPVKATGVQGEQGEKGETGATPQLRVNDGYWQVSYDGGNNWTYITDDDGNKIKATGDKGETGAQGVSVSKIEKTGTEGLVDTYTITLSNGATSTFTVTNGAKGEQGEKGDQGVSVTSIEKTSSEGLVDTYTITLSNGATSTFTVTNGAKGDTGDSGKDGITPKVKIGKGNYWYVSYDNGKTWTSLGAKAPVAKTYASKSFAKGTYSGKTITVKWNRIENAKGYEIYAAKCSTKGKLIQKKNLVKTVKKASTLKTSLKSLKNGKALETARNYKVQVRAYRIVKGKKQYLTASPAIHLTNAQNKTYTNAKKVTASPNAVTFKAGASKTVKAKVTKVSSKKKLLPAKHVKSVRYYTTDSAVAKVSSSGKITAKKKGSCKVYAVAANGQKAIVKVTVK